MIVCHHNCTFTHQVIALPLSLLFSPCLSSQEKLLEAKETLKDVAKAGINVMASAAGKAAGRLNKINPMRRGTSPTKDGGGAYGTINSRHATRCSVSCVSSDSVVTENEHNHL